MSKYIFSVFECIISIFANIFSVLEIFKHIQENFEKVLEWKIQTLWISSIARDQKPTSFI